MARGPPPGFDPRTAQSVPSHCIDFILPAQRVFVKNIMLLLLIYTGSTSGADYATTVGNIKKMQLTLSNLYLPVSL
jgi:hypothetical protein